MKMKRWVAVMLVLVSIVSILPTPWGVEIEADAVSDNGIEVGECITLGTYNGEPIVWRCVLIDENGPLMLCKDILCNKEYDAAGENSTYHIDGWGYIRTKYGSNCWQDSNIRQWLNSDEANVSWTHCAPSYANESGFLSNFTVTELSSMKPVTRIVNVNEYESRRSGYCDGGRTDSIASALTSNTFNPEYYYYKYLQDKVFLLSARDYNAIYRTNKDYLIADRDYYTCIADGSGGACYEWVSFISANSANAVHNYSANNKRGIRPAFYLDVEQYQESLQTQHVGILKDYVISVALDETGVNWISEITVGSTNYYVEQGTLNLTQAKQLQYKKVFYTLSNGTVDFVCDLDSISTLRLDTDNELVLNYKNGRFPDKKIELSGIVTNLIDASVDSDFVQSLGSLSLTNITVELLSDNTDIIYFKEHWYSSKKQHIKFSIDGSVPPGTEITFSKNIYVNTRYAFPEDKESDSMRVTCLITAQKNGKTITDVREINVKLENGDFGYKQSVKPTWKTQTLDELLDQMRTESNNCVALSDSEKVEVAMVIEEIKKSIHLLGIKDDFENYESVYDMACYFFDLECPTVGTAAAAFLDAIIAECETASDELKGQLRVAMQLMTKSDAFNTFIKSYKENYDTVIGNKKGIIVKCPVDVLVTDEDGNTVLAVVNDEVVYEAEGTAGFVCDSKKILFLPTDIDHQIQITATDNGTMDYSVTEYSSTGEARVVSYSDVVLTKDKVCTGGVVRDAMPDESVYQLTEMTLDRPAFSGASLTLQDNITISFKASEDRLLDAGYTSPYVMFEMNGEKTVISDYRVIEGKYLFDFDDISPDHMNDTIKATLYATHDGIVYQSETREYSVADYCYNMLDKYCSDDYTRLRTLLVDLLNYGAASQVYMNYKTDGLVNAKLTEAQKAWGTRTQRPLETVQNLEYKTILNPTVQWKGGGLNLQKSVAMRFKISADSIETLVVKVRNDAGDETVISSDAFEATNGGYYVFYDGMNANQMSESVYLTVYDGDIAVSNTIRYSIESYAASKQNSDDTNLSALVIAMMKYGDSAYSYVN